jgi:multidrug efflux pump subunit AcrA (membrane-fusion protein)
MAEDTTKTQDPQQQQQPIDPGLLEQTKNQIRTLVAEIADLADSDIQPPEFYQEFMTRAVAAVAASGGALWMLDNRGTLKLQSQLEFRLTGLLDGKVRTQPHDVLLGTIFQAAQAQIIPPGATIEGVPGAGNPTPFALIIAPLVVDKQVVGLVEILMDPSRRAATQKSTLRFVGDLCDLAAQYLKNRQMRQMMSQQKLWNQLEGFTHAIHGSLDLQETAYAVANDGKRLIGCDRLSVALKISGRTMIEAVSGQEVVEQKSNLIRELTKLCKLVIKSGEDLVYTGDTEGFPPDIRDALEIYVDESGSKAVIITLLHRPEEPTKDGKVPERIPFGCIVAEQIGDELVVTDVHARSEVVSRHASTALYNSQEHHRIFLRPVLKAMSSPWRFFRGRTLAKIAGVLAVLVAVILVMTFVPWKLTIEGKGSILPEERRNTYAPLPSRVAEVHAEHGDLVREGDPLVTLYSEELLKQLEQLQADRAYYGSQETTLGRRINNTTDFDERPILAGQMEEARIRKESALEQIDIIREQLQQLNITAPHDGMVVTWEVRKSLLGRPVEVGQELVSVASTTGEWVLEVNVPDDDMAPILAAETRLQERIAAGEAGPEETLTAYFVLATDPEHRYPGHVRRIASKAETVEGEHVVKVTVGFSDEVRDQIIARSQNTDRGLRAGAEVRARIECGDARLAYVLFRDVINAFHETVLFRWPFMN